MSPSTPLFTFSPSLLPPTPMSPSPNFLSFVVDSNDHGDNDYDDKSDNNDDSLDTIEYNNNNIDKIKQKTLIGANKQIEMINRYKTQIRQHQRATKSNPKEIFLFLAMYILLAFDYLFVEMISLLLGLYMYFDEIFFFLSYIVVSIFMSPSKVSLLQTVIFLFSPKKSNNKHHHHYYYYYYHHSHYNFIKTTPTNYNLVVPFNIIVNVLIHIHLLIFAISLLIGVIYSDEN